MFLPALLLLAACSDSPAELLAKANQAYAAHDYTAARLHVTEALQAEPGNRTLLMLQARTLLALGDGAGARAALEKLSAGQKPTGELAELGALAAILRRKPDVAVSLLEGVNSVEADRLRAVAALQLEDLPRAEKYLASAVSAGGSAQVFADYARVYLLKGDLANASAMAAKAESAGPELLGTMLIGGEIAARKGDLAAALRHFDKAARLYPSNVAAMTGKASVLGDLGRMDELEAALAPLVAAVPKDPAVIYLRARLASSRKDWKGVRALLQPIEGGLEQQDPMRLLNAEALLRLGQAEQAIAQAGPIARAHPDNRLAVRLLAESQLAAGDARAAQATLGPIAASVQARPEELALMAKIAKASGDPAAAQIEARSRQPSPQALGADLAEADAAMRGGDWARATLAYGRIQAVTDGRNVMVLNNMAYAQSMLGNHAKAADFAARALKLAPDNASVLDTAGWVQLRSGKNLSEAKRLLLLAAEKAPQNAAIREHLAAAERTAS